MTRQTRQTIAAVALALVATLIASPATAAEPATTSFQMYMYVPPIVRWLGHSRDAAATLGLTYDPTNTDANEVAYRFPLITNVDVAVHASVTPFTNPDDPSDTLTTYWQIADDAALDPTQTGVRRQDADPEKGYGAFVSGEDFLRGGIYITHAPGDGNVKFTVTARGEKPALDVERAADAPGYYEATVVLTALPYVSFGALRNRPAVSERSPR